MLSARKRAVTVFANVVVLAAVAWVSVGTLHTSHALASLGLAAVMLRIATIDAEQFRIPDTLSLPAIPAGLLASGWVLHPDRTALIEASHLAGAALGGAVLWLLAWGYRRKRGFDGLGLGDVKLAAAAGAWVGAELLSIVLLLAALSALVWIVCRSALRGEQISPSTRVPFGTFLAPSIWTTWFYFALDGV